MKAQEKRNTIPDIHLYFNFKLRADVFNYLPGTRPGKYNDTDSMSFTRKPIKHHFATRDPGGRGGRFAM